MPRIVICKSVTKNSVTTNKGIVIDGKQKRIKGENNKTAA